MKKTMKTAKKKRSKNGGRKKARTRSQTPERLPDVQAVGRELLDNVSAAGRDVQVVRAELDQHKNRMAKTALIQNQAIMDLEKRLDKAELLAQKTPALEADNKILHTCVKQLEAAIGKSVFDDLHRARKDREHRDLIAAESKSPAEEAGDVDSVAEAAAIEASIRVYEDGAEKKGDDKWRHVAISISNPEKALAEILGALKEHKRWEGGANAEIHELGSKVRAIAESVEDLRNHRLEPPAGCELVVRRER